MKSSEKWFLLVVFSGLFLAAAPAPSLAQATTCTVNSMVQPCTATGFTDTDGSGPLNACVVNPTVPVTGTIVGGAGSCNIGVYINTDKKVQVGDDKNILTTEISGFDHYGVLVDGTTNNNNVSADVTNTKIHAIKDATANFAAPCTNAITACQHGVGISYRAFQSLGLIGTAGGTVSNNNVYDYQKGGIEANGQGVNVTIRNNVVTGQGSTPMLAANGIQVGFGANGTVTGNNVSSNSFTTDNNFAATGVLVVGGPFYNGNGSGNGVCPGSSASNPCPYTTGTMVLKNTLTNNDVGAYLFNTPDGVNPPPTMTNDKVVNNTMSLTSPPGCSNVYMTGATDVGFNDKIINNVITGYNTASCFPVDPGGTRTHVAASPHP